MLPYVDPVIAPSSDKRWKIVAATMRKLGNQRNALIEALHTAQDAFGFLDKPALLYIAATLRVPLSQVYGAATFYHYFTMKPQGKHSCIVCTGTACHMAGSRALLDGLKQRYKINDGETTPDRELSLLTARCFGACGLAPVAVIDGEVNGRLTAAKLQEGLEKAMLAPC